MNLVEGRHAGARTTPAGPLPVRFTGLAASTGGSTPNRSAVPDTARTPQAPSTPGTADTTGTADDPAGQDLPLDHTQAILEVTKKVAAVLKSSDCPFALVGSVAAYAYGIPVRLQHDTDFAVRREDADTVVGLLRDHGIEIVDPPEDWLVKARQGGEHIDLIFALAGRPVTSELLERAWTLPVDSVHMPVIDPTDLMVGRLAALSEHHCDYGKLLPVARGLRERVAWDRVREETGDRPMAAAFLYLLELLDVIRPREDSGGEASD
ncbi:nucleotidyltransferase family protein [Streptomyces exfoliatus]|uniref:nucleotidyltransferase family protein n=1 Tax=Streptomyces exfoliatus TaxID=1905 RepID=UPI003C2AB68A